MGVNKFVLAMIFCGLVGMLIPGEILKGKSKKYQESIRLVCQVVMDLLVEKCRSRCLDLCCINECMRE